MNPAAAQLPIDWDLQRIALEVQWLRAPDAGAASPLIVFLHEGLGSVAMWKDFPQQLCEAAHCRGLLISRPGYG
jgi:pimeloyl-ACP methyl ester carboxylesterase